MSAFFSAVQFWADELYTPIVFFLLAVLWAGLTLNFKKEN